MTPQPMFLDPSSRRKAVLRLEDVPVPGGRLHLSVEGGAIVLVTGGTADARLRLLGICAGHSFGGPGRCLIEGQDTRALDGPALAELRARFTARVLRLDRPGHGLSLLSATAALALSRGLPTPTALHRARVELLQLGLGAHLHAPATARPEAEQRLALLARARTCRPALLVVEDADHGLDAARLAVMRRALVGAAEQGACVIVSSQHPGMSGIATQHLRIGHAQPLAA